MGFINRSKIKQFIITGYYLTPEDYLRKHGVRVGKGCRISPCYTSSEGFLIEIGDYCRISKDVAFYTHGMLHSIKKYYNDTDIDWFGKIKIGNHVSIGEGCKILAGVTIGDNVIIGAGSVVTKSIPSGYMVAGNPIKHIGYTDDWYKKIKEVDLKSAKMSYEDKKKYLLSLSDDKFVKKPYIKRNEQIK